MNARLSIIQHPMSPTGYAVSQRPVVGRSTLLEGQSKSWNRNESNARIVHEVRIEVDSGSARLQ
jgi:hypothetical protein